MRIVNTAYYGQWQADMYHDGHVEVSDTTMVTPEMWISQETVDRFGTFCGVILEHVRSHGLPVSPDQGELIELTSLRKTMGPLFTNGLPGADDAKA